MHLLVIEDERALCETIVRSLRRLAYSVDYCYDGNRAMELLGEERYDLVLLDLNLPGADGMTVLKTLRQTDRETRVLILSARSEVTDKVAGLDAGANDYLTKPFGTVELLARIRTALRHTRRACGGEEMQEGRYIVGELVIDYNKHRAYLAGQDAGLTPSEFKILALLGRTPGRVLTSKQELRELWGPAANPRDNKLLRVHMANLRRKLEPNPEEPRYLFTEVGVGYRLAEGDAPDGPDAE